MIPVAEARPGIATETAMVIAAAVAAYLGKKPCIRQIRLLGFTAWSEQGRVTIQGWYSVSPAQR